MPVQIVYQNIDKRIEYKSVIRNLIRKLINSEGKKLGEISIVFTSNEDILRINRDFLKHSYYTDVITFPYIKREIVSGDIFISLDQVEINSRKCATKFSDEVTRVIIHGVLHLLGYNDSTNAEKNVIRKKEDHYLCRFKEEDFLRQ